MQGAGKLKNKTINCIPNNMEKYISFWIGHLNFLDSLQFMNASFEKLISNLAPVGHGKFHALKRYIVSRKGGYPYNYVDNMSKF